MHGVNRVTVKRDQIWQHRRIASESALIREELHTVARDQSPTLAVDLALTRARHHRAEKDFLPQLKSFLYAVGALRLDAESRRLSAKETTRLKKLAETILREQNVRHGTSHLSFLHAQLHAAMAAVAASRGDIWMANWRKHLAAYAAGASLEPLTMQLLQARQLLRFADVPSCLGILENIPEGLLSPLRLPEARGLSLRAIRLSGDCFGALERIAELKAEGKPATDPWLAWEEHLCHAQLSQDLEPMLAALRRSSSLRRSPYVEEASLWCFAVQSRKWLTVRPTVLGQDPSLESLRRFLAILAKCYDLSVPMEQRLEELGGAIGKIHQLECLSHELLALGGAARWLHRARQSQLCAQLAARYRAHCLGLSSGVATDTLGALADIVDIGASLPRTSQTSVETSWLRRSASLSSLSVEIASVVGRKRFHQLFCSEEKAKRLKDSEASAIIEIAVRHLGALKGPVMKVGQTASYFGLQVPAHAAEQLRELQDAAPPLEVDQVKLILERELEAGIDDLFLDFSSDPIGVGSIGQVHRAILPSGKPVAVKVRYPGIEEAIESDMLTLRLVLPLLRLFSSRAFTRDLFTELRERLLEECDYQRELRLQQQFREKFRDHPDIHIPNVVPSHSGRRVLTTELVAGRKFNDFVTTASPAQKERAGRAITEFVVSSCRDGFFNADPHPGNFLFFDDKVCFLDFGSVKFWTPTQASGWADAITAAINRDFPLFRRSLLDMNLIANPRNFDFRAMYDVYLNGSMGNAGTLGKARFDHELLHREIRSVLSKDFLPHITVNPNYLYGFRVYLGLISVLAELQADCDFHSQLQEIMTV